MNFKKEDAVKVYSSKEIASKYVANRIASVIKSKQDKGEKAIIGLATGATPKDVYKELIRLHRSEGLSFKNVVTFNLDEYYPMMPIEERSYTSFMKNNLFDHIDIVPSNIHIPDGTLSLDGIGEYCNWYETKIANLGGLDLQLLGIGRTGHIGFNEPGSLEKSQTRLVTLNSITREDAIFDFGGLENVPKQAITMGIQTISSAKEIILLALTKKKAEIMRKALQGNISSEVPATYLQQLTNVEYILDQDAASLIEFDKVI